jgi:hypothetical protein
MVMSFTLVVRSLTDASYDLPPDRHTTHKFFGTFFRTWPVHVHEASAWCVLRRRLIDIMRRTACSALVSPPTAVTAASHEHTADAWASVRQEEEMRVLTGMALVATLAIGPGPAAEARTAATDDPPPEDWKKLTSLRVLPEHPHQNDIVRIFAHCPVTADHAIIGSTAFALKGSRRLYREVGLGLSDRGLGRRAAGISYYALLGHHEVRMTCVKVTIDPRTRFRKIQVISRCTVPLTVRRFRLSQFS